MNNYFTLIRLPEKGTGVFANRFFNQNEELGIYLENVPTKIGRKVGGVDNLWESDILGRFCNHSGNPNTYFKNTEQDFMLYSLKSINIGDEITVNYNTVDKLLGLPIGIVVFPYFVKKDYKEYGKVICEY
jgi:hypothetical protein